MALCSQRAAHTFAADWLTRPFTPSSLRQIRRFLDPEIEPCAIHKATGGAGVLVPFCNVDNEPSIIFELRAKSLRSHSGEVSFPGGRVDDTDPSFSYTALRETHEELGIEPSRIQILGSFGPTEMNLRGNMRVWPTVGFVHASEASRNIGDEAVLPSLDMDGIRKQASQDEVATTFHLPLSTLVGPSRLRSSLFRGARPYWTIDVTDIVSKHIKTESAQETVDEVWPGDMGKIEVWGLTGWYISVLMRRLGVYQC